MKNKPRPVAAAPYHKPRPLGIPRVLPVKGHPGRWHCLAHGEYAGADADCALCKQENA